MSDIVKVAGYSEDASAILTSSDTSFLPTIKLIHGISPEAGKIRPGNFLIRDNDLGSSFNTVVVAKRPHALLLKDKKKVAESFDPASKEFLDIATYRISDKSSEQKYYGLEFLMWVPIAGNFGTMLFGLPSNKETGKLINIFITPRAEREARPKEFPSISWDLPHTNVLTIWSEMKQFGPKQRSFVPNVRPCTEDLPGGGPDETAIKKALEYFNVTIAESVGNDNSDR